MQFLSPLQVCSPRTLKREIPDTSEKPDAVAGCRYFLTLEWRRTAKDAGPLDLLSLGEFVFVPRPDDPDERSIIHVERMWKDKK